MSISRFVVALAAVLAVAGPHSSAYASAAPDVSCRACVVMADDGTILWERAAEVPLPNASTTKMLTAIVAARAISHDEIVTVSVRAATTGGGGLELQAGAAYRAEDLLYGMLLSSSNDAAVALAEHVAGSEAAFAAEMNRVARRLGATHTHFVTAHGLDVPGHVSSARDLALIGKALLERPRLAAIVATTAAVVPAAAGAGPQTVINRNPLLETYTGAVGIKTGYTASAGNVLVAAATRRGRTVVAVAMNSDDAADDSRRLLDLGFARLRRTLLVRAGSQVGALVFDGLGAVNAVTGRAVHGLADPAELELRFRPDDRLELPVSAGDPVGTVLVSSGPHVVGEVVAVAGQNTPASGSSLLVDILAGLLRALGSVAVHR